VLIEIRPDVVHAHDVFAAKMMLSEFNIPFVYDDHEFWSAYANVLLEMTESQDLDGKSKVITSLPRKIGRTIIFKHAVKLWSKWEKELVSSTNPTITVSHKIAEGLQNLGGNTNKVFVVPNFPLMKEVKDFKKPYFHRKLSSVYAGSDGLHKKKRSNRDIDNLDQIFESHDIGDLTVIGWLAKSSQKVKYKGFLNRESMFNEMSNHSIGLIPWKKHWSHVYSNPNKAYEYAHAGLFVMCTSSLRTVIETLKGNCASFEDYDDMASQIENFEDNIEEFYKKRLQIFEFARSDLIWEKYENNIFRAYQLC
jgi:glycosyltransferase involved in cell wall biosynthesis